MEICLHLSGVMPELYSSLNIPCQVLAFDTCNFGNGPFKLFDLFDC